MPYTDLELAQMQAEALFVHDADGRMLRVNEPEPEPLVPAPYFFFSRTANGNLWRTRYDLPTLGTEAHGLQVASSETMPPRPHATEITLLRVRQRAED